MGKKHRRQPRRRRQSALWGSGNRGGERRSNALWGKGGRGDRHDRSSSSLSLRRWRPARAAARQRTAESCTRSDVRRPRTLLARSSRPHPNEMFHVIVQGNRTADRGSAKDRANEGSATRLREARAPAVRARSTASRSSCPREGDLEQLAQDQGPHRHRVDRSDARGSRSAVTARPARRSSCSSWTYETGVDMLWSDAEGRRRSRSSTRASSDPRPTSADRVIAQVNFVSSAPAELGRRRSRPRHVRRGHRGRLGHGYAGAAPKANLVSLDVMDDQGIGADERRDRGGRVDPTRTRRRTTSGRELLAALGAHEPTSTSTRSNKAVEKLWFTGVIVVAAAGNYGTRTRPSGVRYAPGNDPFVITVGAADIGGTAIGTSDDDRARGRRTGGRTTASRSPRSALRAATWSARSRRARRWRPRRPTRSSPRLHASSPARRSRRRSSRASRRRSSRGTRTGRPTRSRAR